MKKTFILLLTIASLSSCTQTVTMVHTQGQAEDVVDETSSNTPNVSPTINVPVTPGSALGLTK